MKSSVLSLHRNGTFLFPNRKLKRSPPQRWATSTERLTSRTIWEIPTPSKWRLKVRKPVIGSLCETCAADAAEKFAKQVNWRGSVMQRTLPMGI